LTDQVLGHDLAAVNTGQLFLADKLLIDRTQKGAANAYRVARLAA